MTTLYKDPYGKMLDSPNILLATTGQRDYQAYDNEVDVGIYEAKGLRDYQEDRVSFGFVPDWEQLKLSKEINVFKKTFQVLQELYGKHLYQGSTVVTSLIAANKIYTASVGDSAAYLVIFNSNGSLSKFQCLNSLHNPNLSLPEGQRAKLVAEKNSVAIPIQEYSVWRLGDGLAVSRAIGDLHSELYGLSHEPEISEVDFVIPSEGKGFIILACDGLTECMGEEELKKILISCSLQRPDEIAKVLVYAALRRLTTDNVSVIVKSLGTEDHNSTSVILAVFDGHGGSEVSQALSENFLPIFFNILKSRVHS